MTLFARDALDLWPLTAGDAGDVVLQFWLAVVFVALTGADRVAGWLLRRARG